MSTAEENLTTASEDENSDDRPTNDDEQERLARLVAGETSSDPYTN